MKKNLFLIASVTLFIASVFQIGFNLLSTLKAKNLIDFSVYSGALSKFLAGKNPYQFLYGAPTDKIPFNYPPSALIALLPFKLFPPKTAQIILIILSFALFWLTFWLILKLLKIRLPLPHFLILLAFFNQTFPVKFTLVLGQINLIVLGLTFISLYLYRLAKNTDLRGLLADRRRCGRISRLFFIILFSLSSAIKPFPLLTLPLFLLFKDYKFVFLVLTIFFLLNLAPGIDLAKQYFFQIIPSFTQRLGQPNFYDQSILAFLLRLNIEPSLAKNVALGVFLLLYLAILLRFRKKINRPAIQPRFNRGQPFNHIAIYYFSSILALASISGPFSWQHHLIFSYPLIFLSYLGTLAKEKNLKSKVFYNLIFLIIWAFLFFHFKSEVSPYLQNPFIASYQTILILMLVGYSVLKLN